MSIDEEVRTEAQIAAAETAAQVADVAETRVDEVVSEAQQIIEQADEVTGEQAWRNQLTQQLNETREMAARAAERPSLTREEAAELIAESQAGLLAGLKELIQPTQPSPGEGEAAPVEAAPESGAEVEEVVAEETPAEDAPQRKRNWI
jgi:hypothetical protein